MADADPNEQAYVHPGAKVWVEWRGTWWPARVVHPLGDGRYRIHYEGYSNSWDEDVPTSRMAPGATPPPGRRAGTLTPLGTAMLALVIVVAGVGAYFGVQPGAPPHGATEIASLSALHEGQSVWVEWNGEWYEASVLRIDPETVRVHYTGYDGDDEDVSLTRVRGR